MDPRATGLILAPPRTVFYGMTENASRTKVNVATVRMTPPWLASGLMAVALVRVVILVLSLETLIRDVDGLPCIPPVQCRAQMTTMAAYSMSSIMCSMTLLLTETLVVLELTLTWNGAIADLTMFTEGVMFSMVIAMTWLHPSVSTSGMMRVQKLSRLLS